MTPPWELGDPTNGQGFEGAVAYAMAEKLGFPKDKVSWVVVPFSNSFAPGPKTFDFYLAQVSWSIQRAQGADLSRGYYSVNQSVVAMKGSPLEGAKTITELATYKFGAMVGTTSYQTIVDTIKPTQEPSVYDTNDAAIEALKNKQIDGIVVDLPTAFYVTSAQIVTKDFKPLASIVGQFPAPAGRRVLQLRPRQGEPPDRVRQPGARGTQGRRQPRGDHQGVAGRQGERPGLHSVAAGASPPPARRSRDA